MNRLEHRLAIAEKAALRAEQEQWLASLVARIQAAGPDTRAAVNRLLAAPCTSVADCDRTFFGILDLLKAAEQRGVAS